MPRWLLETLNIGFLVFHTALIVFNLIGWAWTRTRRLNLISLLLTLAAWSILGIWYGFGYCPCTDYHWEIRDALGYKTDSPGYVHFLIQTLTGWNAPQRPVEYLTASGLLFGLTMSITLNVRDWRRAKLRRANGVGEPSSSS